MSSRSQPKRAQIIDKAKATKKRVGQGIRDMISSLSRPSSNDGRSIKVSSFVGDQPDQQRSSQSSIPFPSLPDLTSPTQISSVRSVRASSPVKPGQQSRKSGSPILSSPAIIPVSDSQSAISISAPSLATQESSPRSPRLSLPMPSNPPSPVRRRVASLPGEVQPSIEVSVSSNASTETSPPATSSAPSTKKHHDVWSTAWNGMKTAIRLLEKTAGLCPPLKTALGGLVGCLDLSEAVIGNREDYKQLADDLTLIATVLEPYVRNLVERDAHGSIALIISSIDGELHGIRERLDYSMLRRIAHANEGKGDVISRYRKIETLFRHLQNEITLRTWDTSRRILERTLLKELLPIHDARYNSVFSETVKRRGCTAQTREKVLGEIHNWARDPLGAQVYWLNGMAGTGKTTILYTLCEQLESAKQLGASYFCSRTSASCRDVNNILRTVVFQMAEYSLAFRAKLCQVLEDKPATPNLHLRVQFKSLLVNCFQQIKEAIPDSIVIVIDALDECDNDSDLFLKSLLEVASDLPVKFLVSSRPVPSLERESQIQTKLSSVFYLHNIEESLVSADINKYLTEELSAIKPLPLSDDIQTLTEQAGRLFIYAATVVRFISPSNPLANPAFRMRKILKSKGSAIESLDNLYSQVLDSALQDLTEEQQIILLHILKSVVCAQEHLNVQSIATLIEHYSLEKEIEKEDQILLSNVQEISNLLSGIQSVLHISDTGLVSTFHASFPDFLLDKKRSKKYHFDSTQYHHIMTMGCFEVMNMQLHFNICNLESSFMFDKDVLDMENRIKEHISPVLLYASSNWGQHFIFATKSSEKLASLMHFLQYNLLFWMEVLNVQKKLYKGIELLGNVERSLEIGDLNTAVYDSRDFIRRFAGGSGKESTPHIYISALPFCYKESFVYKSYWTQTRRLLNVKGNSLTNKPQAIAELYTESEVICIAYSPDGKHIASGSVDQTIRVWDVSTGECIAGPLEGHTSDITSVAYSPDGKHIASGSDDRTIRVWDASTGEYIAGPLKGHTGYITSVAYSPDGKHIASGSNDQTIRVWDVSTQQTIPAVLAYSKSNTPYPQPLSFSASHFVHSPNGWILAIDIPLFWLSPTFRHQFPLPQQRNFLVISPSSHTRIGYDFDNLFIGPIWSQCFIGPRSV